MNKTTNRMMAKSELGLIVDKNTIILDDMMRILTIVRHHGEYLKPIFQGQSDLALLNIMCEYPTQDFIECLFEESYQRWLKVTYLDPKSLNYIELYLNRDNDSPSTDIGAKLEIVTAFKQVEWFILKETNNHHKISYFSGKEMTTNEINEQTVLEFVNSVKFKVVVVPTAEMAARLMEVFEDITIFYPSYMYNSVMESDYKLFKYEDHQLKYEIDHKIELISYEPLGRFTREERALEQK